MYMKLLIMIIVVEWTFGVNRRVFMVLVFFLKLSELIQSVKVLADTDEGLIKFITCDLAVKIPRIASARHDLQWNLGTCRQEAKSIKLLVVRDLSKEIFIDTV